MCEKTRSATLLGRGSCDFNFRLVLALCCLKGRFVCKRGDFCEITSRIQSSSFALSRRCVAACFASYVPTACRRFALLLSEKLATCQNLRKNYERASSIPAKFKTRVPKVCGFVRAWRGRTPSLIIFKRSSSRETRKRRIAREQYIKSQGH